MKYQIQARVVYDGTAPKGYASSGRECPTFHVYAASTSEAARKALDVLNIYRIPGYQLRIIVQAADKMDPVWGAVQFWDFSDGQLKISNPYPEEIENLQPLE